MRYSVFCAKIYFLGLVTTSISSPYPLAPPTASGSTLKCTTYASIQGPNTTCNEDPHQVCLGGCTGAVVASQCSKEDDFSVQATQLVCTISYSQPSLERGVCVSQEGTFFCEGIPTGEATCSGCAPVVSEPALAGPHTSNNSHPDPAVSAMTNSSLSLSTAALQTGNRGMSNLFGLAGILVLVL